VFLTIVLTIWTGMHVYVFWRAASIPVISRNISSWLLIVLAAILWSSFFAPRFFHFPQVISRSLEFLGENWLGVLFLLFICLLVVDIITGFGFLLSRKAPTLRGLALLAGLGLSIFAFVQGFRAPVVNDYEFNMADLPNDADGLVIVVLTDLHVAISPGEGWLETQVERVNAMNPDVIILAGDIIEGHGSDDRYQRISEILRRFSAPLGVWGVTGNHERYSGHESSLHFLAQANVELLHNEWRELRPGFILAGVDDGREMRDSDDIRNRFESALNGRPDNSATLFVSHRPNGAEIAAELGADLMLSGHTHGGQIWPFDYITARFNDLLEGKYIINGMPVIVSNGTGTWGPRMRLWTPGEILRITLRAER
jgi:predicted MPP superfamily phosphohydrolase